MVCYVYFETKKQKRPRDVLKEESDKLIYILDVCWKGLKKC